MSKLTVYDMKGASVGDVEVADSLLVTERGAQAVHDVVLAHQAAKRAGTASTLNKSGVAGSGKKPWKQKGTGRARAGYRQSPVWRGGGVAFGPHPRDYTQKVNRKVARLAFRRVVSEKIAADAVKVVDAIEMSEPKTRQFLGFLKSLGVQGPALVVMDAADRNVALASRNLPRVELARAADVSVYQWLRYPTVLISRAAMETIKARMGAA